MFCLVPVYYFFPFFFLYLLFSVLRRHARDSTGFYKENKLKAPTLFYICSSLKAVAKSVRTQLTTFCDFKRPQLSYHREEKRDLCKRWVWRLEGNRGLHFIASKHFGFNELRLTSHILSHGQGTTGVSYNRETRNSVKTHKTVQLPHFLPSEFTVNKDIDINNLMTLDHF